MHQVLLELLAAGLSWDEAHQLPLEDVLCLLRCIGHQRELAMLDAEAARIAGLPFADAAEVQRLLARLRHQAATAAQRFQRGG